MRACVRGRRGRGGGAGAEGQGGGGGPRRILVACTSLLGGQHAHPAQGSSRQSLLTCMPRMAPTRTRTRNARRCTFARLRPSAQTRIIGGATARARLSPPQASEQPHYRQLGTPPLPLRCTCVAPAFTASRQRPPHAMPMPARGVVQEGKDSSGEIELVLPPVAAAAAVHRSPPLATMPADQRMGLREACCL
jgi:hypothetical protein